MFCFISFFPIFRKIRIFDNPDWVLSELSGFDCIYRLIAFKIFGKYFFIILTTLVQKSFHFIGILSQIMCILVKGFCAGGQSARALIKPSYDGVFTIPFIYKIKGTTKAKLVFAVFLTLADLI